MTASLYQLVLRLLILGMLVAANIDVARVERGDADVSMTPQAVGKILLLGLIGLAGAWGWWRSSQSRAYLMSLPGLLFLALGFWHFASVPTAVSRVTALAGAIAYTAALLGVVSAIAHLGIRRVLYDMILAFLIYVFGSVLFYVLFPEKGIFIEVMDATTKVPRLGGLGHPNILGRNCAFVTLFCIAAAFDRVLNWKWCLVVIPLLTAITLAALSRTPLIALVATLLFLAIPLLRQSKYFYALGGCAFACVLLVLVLEFTVGFDTLASKVISSGTKTGSVEEVTSVTGRTKIWTLAIELIREQPIFGHGTGSLPILMSGESGHAHNILLSPTASLGLPGGCLLFAILIWNIFTAYRYPVFLLRAMVSFIVIVGLVESPLLGPTPDGMTFFWFAISIWPLILEREKRSKLQAELVNGIQPSIRAEGTSP